MLALDAQEDYHAHKLKQFPLAFFYTPYAIVTDPAHLEPNDVKWTRTCREMYQFALYSVSV